MTDFVLTRKSLGTRLAETMTARGYHWTNGVDALGRLTYVVEKSNGTLCLTPGELADWLGIPITDDGSWKK